MMYNNATKRPTLSAATNTFVNKLFNHTVNAGLNQFGQSLNQNNESSRTYLTSSKTTVDQRLFQKERKRNIKWLLVV